LFAGVVGMVMIADCRRFRRRLGVHHHPDPAHHSFRRLRGGIAVGAAWASRRRSCGRPRTTCHGPQPWPRHDIVTGHRRRCARWPWWPGPDPIAAQ